MRRVLSLMLIAVLVVANGTAVAGAICRHESMAMHSAARQSADLRVADLALGEETAGSVASQKGAPAYAGAIAWVADLVPGPHWTAPFDPARALEPEPAPVRPLAGRSLAPPLKPPAA
jgi:hypothetical protein